MPVIITWFIRNRRKNFLRLNSLSHESVSAEKNKIRYYIYKQEKWIFEKVWDIDDVHKNQTLNMWKRHEITYSLLTSIGKFDMLNSDEGKR